MQRLGKGKFEMLSKIVICVIGWQADLIVDILLSHITSYNLVGLTDYWKGLDERVFSRLESFYHSCTQKLYFSLLKYYVVSASLSNKYVFS